jgi:ubiquinol-cytochrome c reductase cytochrome b subunit
MESRRPITWRVWEWFDIRYDLSTLSAALLHVEIPRTARTFYFGGITLFFFIVQVITGALLVVYYQPTPEAAYDSILLIMNDANFGWLIRSIHAWSANLMILFCVLHLLRVFFQGAYKRPREVTWGVGFVLLLLTLAFGFTGYLLPWDQRAFWATTVGGEIAAALPIVGQLVSTFLLGGTEITARTLSRFFGVHVLFLPLSVILLIVAHITMVHQQGLADPSRERIEPTDEWPGSSQASSAEEEKSRLLPFFPNYVLDEVIAWYVMLAAIVVLASLFPAGLEEPADPLRTPPHTKPEWYFLFLYQGLKVVPRIVGVTLPLVAGAIVFLLPFLDRNPYIAARRRPIVIMAGLISVAGIIIFTVWGWLS